MTGEQALTALSDKHGKTIYQTLMRNDVDDDTLAGIAAAIILQTLALAHDHPAYAAHLLAASDGEVRDLLTPQVWNITQEFPIEMLAARG